MAGLCYGNRLERVRPLLVHGANPDRGRTESLKTPLHHALANDASLELVEQLIAHNADVNARTNAGSFSSNYLGDTPTRGETPLHRAAAYASKEVIRSLLAAGAGRPIADANGHLPCYWAGWHRRRRSLVQMLQAA